MTLKPADLLPVGDFAGRKGLHVTDRFAIWNLAYIDGQPKAVENLRAMSEETASVLKDSRWAPQATTQSFVLPDSTPGILDDLRVGEAVTWTGLSAETMVGTRRGEPVLVLTDATGAFHFIDARYRSVFLNEDLNISWHLALPRYRLGGGANAEPPRITKVVGVAAAEPQCRVAAFMLARPETIVGLDLLKS